MSVSAASPGAPQQPRQRHGGVVKTTVFGSGDVRFAVPERIQHADQRRALAGKIVQVEQLNAAETRRAQRRFDLFLVAEHLKFAGRHEEVFRLAQHPMFRQRLAEDFKILRLERAGVFRHLVKVRIDAPLAHFVNDDGHVEFLEVAGHVAVADGPFSNTRR